jgi:type IV pilus assembly protein PilM
MAGSGGPAVGIDIGSNTIKVAEVVPGKGGVVVRALGMAPTPQEAVENGVVIDPKLLSEAVKKLLKECGAGQKRSVSSVSGQGGLVVRVVEVPQMSDADLVETMKWEVERQVPFAADEVIMDYVPIHRPDTPPDAQNMEVLMAVAQQDMIYRHVEMLKMCGLKPGAIDVEPLAAARSLIELGPDPYGTKTTVIVNIGASNTDIGVFRDGLLAFPRTLPVAGDAMTRAIAQAMGVGIEQAEEIKVSKGEILLGQAGPGIAAPADTAFMDFSLGVPDEPASEPAPFDFTMSSETEPVGSGEEAVEPTGSFETGASASPVVDDPEKLQISQALSSVLNDLVSELRRSLEYYRGRSVDGRIDEILLCGGTARLKGLAEFLQAELGIPARVADPFAYATVISKGYSPEYLEQIAPVFAVAVGLAARDLIKVPVTAAASGGKKRGRK